MDPVPEWHTVPLGEVARLDVDAEPVRAGGRYAMAGLLIAGGGLFARGELRGSDTSYPKLHRLRAGQLVMRKLTAWEGPITIVPAAFDGSFVSTEFPTFTLDESRLDPNYMRLICQLPAFHLEMKMRSTGTAERRKRLNPDGLLAIEVSLPPLQEQRRIVDGLRKLDTLVSAYGAERDAAAVALAAARMRLLASLPTCPLRDRLVDVQAGKSPRALDRPPVHGEVGVLKVSAIRSADFRPAEAKAVIDDTTFSAHAAVEDGDVLISRANTRALVGAVCRVHGHHPNLYLSDKTLRLVPDESIDADFLVQALAAPAAREHLEMNATGTSDSMKNVSQDTILATPIPDIVDVTTQRDLARRLGGLSAAATDASHLAGCVMTLRAALLEALTSGSAQLDEQSVLEA
jgi:type I restriction enzyme S subunit